jgi:hypothetical protein
LRAAERRSRIEIRNVAHSGPKQIELDDATPTIFVNRMPSAGLHVDVAQRTLFAWCSHTPTIRSLPRWPGWTLESLEDRFEAHAEKSGGAIVFPLDELRELARQRLDEWLGSSTEPLR